jgi:hypothetical protein
VWRRPCRFFADDPGDHDGDDDGDDHHGYRDGRDRWRHGHRDDLERRWRWGLDDGDDHHGDDHDGDDDHR